MPPDANDKQQLLTMLRDVFNHWEKLLAGMPEHEITDPKLPDNWSIKDVVAHLWAWQQRSIARQKAALEDAEPDYASWSTAFGSDPEEDVDKTNAWLYEASRDKPWQGVYSDWRAQFLRLLELAEQMPEKDLLDPARYAWMGGDPLSASLEGTYEHHKEHLEQLLAWLDRNRKTSTGDAE